jgi:DNA-binding FadR family transcriptional regulator
VQPVVVLQHRDVGERVAVDEQQVGEVAGLHLAQLVRDRDPDGAQVAMHRHLHNVADNLLGRN